jgi:hypothetical protein
MLMGSTCRKQLTPRRGLDELRELGDGVPGVQVWLGIPSGYGLNPYPKSSHQQICQPEIT